MSSAVWLDDLERMCTMSMAVIGIGLDLAVAMLVLRAAPDHVPGVVVPDFLPQGWRRT